eukprot:1599353-Amphidinium_carterae.1
MEDFKMPHPSPKSGIRGSKTQDAGLKESSRYPVNDKLNVAASLETKHAQTYRTKVLVQIETLSSSIAGRALRTS